MVVTERGGERQRERVREKESTSQCCFSSHTHTHTPPQPETSYNTINLVPQGGGKIWQLSEFYMKILPPLIHFSPGWQHPSAGGLNNEGRGGEGRGSSLCWSDWSLQSKCQHSTEQQEVSCDVTLSCSSQKSGFKASKLLYSRLEVSNPWSVGPEPYHRSLVAGIQRNNNN